MSNQDQEKKINMNPLVLVDKSIQEDDTTLTFLKQLSSAVKIDRESKDFKEKLEYNTRTAVEFARVATDFQVMQEMFHQKDKQVLDIVRPFYEEWNKIYQTHLPGDSSTGEKVADLFRTTFSSSCIGSEKCCEGLKLGHQVLEDVFRGIVFASMAQLNREQVHMMRPVLNL